MAMISSNGIGSRRKRMKVGEDNYGKTGIAC